MVRMLQEMIHIDDALAEVQAELDAVLARGQELVLLKGSGVTALDENYQPITPDNVVLFPAHRRKQ